MASGAVEQALSGWHKWQPEPWCGLIGLVLLLVVV